jgi:hypothetical protein
MEGLDFNNAAYRSSAVWFIMERVLTLRLTNPFTNIARPNSLKAGIV